MAHRRLCVSAKADSAKADSVGAKADAGDPIARIVERLRAPIPKRPTPPPKPRASWHGLRVGDKLTKQGDPRVVWLVERCDSGGAYLRVVTPFLGNTALYLTDPRDLEALAKVAKPRQSRKRKVKVDAESV